VDDRVRALERAWRASGSKADALTYYRELARLCPLPCPSCGGVETVELLFIASGHRVPVPTPAVHVSRLPVETCARCGARWDRHAPAKVVAILEGDHPPTRGLGDWVEVAPRPEPDPLLDTEPAGPATTPPGFTTFTPPADLHRSSVLGAFDSEDPPEPPYDEYF
jgi:hypothetical protein